LFIRSAHKVPSKSDWMQAKAAPRISFGFSTDRGIGMRSIAAALLAPWAALTTPFRSRSSDSGRARSTFACGSTRQCSVACRCSRVPTSADVDTLVCDGKVLKRNGQPLQMDLKKIVAEAELLLRTCAGALARTGSHAHVLTTIPSTQGWEVARRWSVNPSVLLWGPSSGRRTIGTSTTASPAAR
jgi:hypothetical protein